MNTEYPYRIPYATLNGIKVFVYQDKPKMQLSERVCEVLTPDFIAETNAWMLDFFGTWNILKDGDYVMDIPNGRVYMNPRTYVKFKAYVKAEQQVTDFLRSFTV